MISSAASFVAPILRRAFAWLGLFGFALGLGAANTALAQAPAGIAPGCTVMVLNRSVRVDPRGNWGLGDIPANRGLVRARAVCVENGVVRSGVTPFFSLIPNRQVEAPDIDFAAVAPIPRSLRLEAPTPVLRSLGESTTLRVIARMPDGSEVDLAGRETTTLFTSSNPRVVSIDLAGNVRAEASGAALVSATYEGAIGLLLVRVELSGDSDGDGIPDDVEIASGLDPNDAGDGFEDPDGDGLASGDERMIYGTDFRVADSDGDRLSDGEEVRAGADGYITSPLVADTDGDRFKDGLEVETGSNPTDRASFNLPAAIAALRVGPSGFLITLDVLWGRQTTHQLAATATLRDGTELDVSSPIYGVTYAGNSACGVQLDGVVLPAASGACTVTANVGTTQGAATGRVRVSPGPLGFVDIPGYANRVAASGDFAFVAAGSAGLVVVDVSDPLAPTISAQLALAGNANDIRLVEGVAYVAAGAAGLHVLDVSNPLSPTMLGSVDTPGVALDVALANGYAYLADGTSGLTIVDVSSPSAPVLVANLALPSRAVGVDVDGAAKIAVVVFDASAVQVIDVSVAASPVAIGVRETPDPSYDVALALPFAYVAGNGLSIIDLSNPAAPTLVRSAGDNTYRDIALTPARLGFTSDRRGADVYLSIFDLNRPRTTTVASGSLPFFELGNAESRGEAIGVTVDDRYVYTTATRLERYQGKPGVNGPTRLYLGDYANFEDTGGLAPTVQIADPTEGEIVAAGSQRLALIEAVDDVAVAEVRLAIDGVVVGRDSVPPYRIDYTVPTNDGAELTAIAVDFGGNVATSAVVHLTLDRAPTVEIQTPLEGASARAGTLVAVQALVSDDRASANVVLLANGVSQGTFAPPYQRNYRVPLDVTSVRFEVVATDSIGQVTRAERTITVIPDLPPTVEIVTPAEGTQVVAGSSIEVSVVGADDLGVVRLDVLVNGESRVFFGATGSAVFPVPLGATSLLIEAGAIDTVLQAAVARRTLVVVDPPPSVVIASPAEGVRLRAGEPATFEATATDNGGITAVALRVNGVEIARPTAPPYVAMFMPPNGASEVALEAVAFDTQGQSASAARTVPIVAGEAPEVSFISPAVGERWIEGAEVFVHVDAQDPDGIREVRFTIPGYIDYVLTEPPYRVLHYAPFGVSEQTIEVIATDRGGVSTTITRTVEVIADPLTEVVGRALNPEGLPVAGAAVFVRGRSTTTEADGTFRLVDVPTVAADGTGFVVVFLRQANAQGLLSGASAPTATVPAGVTDVGDISLSLAVGAYLGDPPSDSQGQGSETFDLQAVVVEPREDEVWITLQTAGGFDQGQNAVLSFDLDQNAATGSRPEVDSFYRRSSGLGAELELHVDDSQVLEAVPFTRTDTQMTLRIPLAMLGGDAVFDLAVALYDTTVRSDGGGGAFAPATEAVDGAQRLLLPFDPYFTSATWDIAPNRGSLTVPSLPDVDGDRLDLISEVSHGTDPALFDTDGDAMDDGWEVSYELDPLDLGDGFSDLDGDRFQNLDEYFYGSHPRELDADGDGLSDNEEVNWGGDPLALDGDRDGLTDVEESNTFVSRANLFDSDRDGLSDYRELRELLTLPDSSDSDAGGQRDGLELVLDETDPLDETDDRREIELAVLDEEGIAISAPAGVRDAAGNLHLTWVQDFFGNPQVYYALRSASGTTLIAPTHLTATLAPRSPAIAVDGGGRVHLAWRDRRFGTDEIWYRLIDPSLDDQDGSPALNTAITVVNDRQISVQGGSAAREPHLVADGSGRIHLLWSEGGQVRYIQLNGAGTTTISARVLGTGNHPHAVADGRGGLHVVWDGRIAPEEASVSIIYHLFDQLSPSASAPLIAATRLHRERGSASTDARLALGADDELVVVYQEERRAEVRVVRIAPYLDDRDGDSADLAQIVRWVDRSVSFGSLDRGSRGERSSAAIDDAGQTWIVFESREAFDPNQAGSVHLAVLAPDGKPRLPIQGILGSVGGDGDPGVRLIDGGDKIDAIATENLYRLLLRPLR